MKVLGLFCMKGLGLFIRPVVLDDKGQRQHADANLVVSKET